MSRPKPQKEKHTKKVVVVIVEGPSDKALLEVSLSEFFEQKYGEDTITKFAMFEHDDGTYGTDITSLHGSNPEKIEMLINKKIILPALEVDGLFAKHITEIVHIIDTDGTFIPDDKVVSLTEESLNPQKNVYYYEDHISAVDVGSILERNHRKTDNINQLLKYCKDGFPVRKYVSTETRGNKPSTKSSVAPYSLYFFSCNMDHFTSGEQNWTGSKLALAENFLKNNGEGFDELKAFFDATDPDTSAMTLSDSWQYIAEGINSLQRHSNLGILFRTLPE